MNPPVPSHDEPRASTSEPSLDGIAAVIEPRIAPVIAAGQHDDPWTAPRAARERWVPVRPADGPVVLETPGGAWQLGTDPDTGWCVAGYRPGPPGTDTLFDAPTATLIAASSWDLESRLGAVLPDTVHTALRSGRAVLPTPPDPTTGPDGGKEVETDAARLPTPAGLVHVPGRTADTYRRALAASRVAHVWFLDSLENPADTFRVDIVALQPAASDAGEILPGRKVLVYRLSCNRTVVFAGDDLEVPAGIDIRGDDTLRSLIGMLCDPDPDMALTRRQQTFLTRHADELRSLVTDIPTPYPPGTRVAVRLPDGTPTTGTVLEAIKDTTGTVRSYGWRPDSARLPGHPWQPDTGHRRNRIVSPAGAATATLRSPDTELDSHSPHLPLPYRTTVTYLTDDTREVTGEVVRAMPTTGGYTYQVRFPDAPREPIALDGRDIVPVTGTAWHCLEDVLRARLADTDIPITSGELLTIAGHCVTLRPGPDGSVTTTPFDVPAAGAEAAGAIHPRAGPDSTDPPDPDTATGHSPAPGTLPVDPDRFRATLHDHAPRVP